MMHFSHKASAARFNQESTNDSLVRGCICCKRRVIFVFVFLFEVYLFNIGLFVKNTELIVSIDKLYAVIITIFRLIHMVDVDPVCLVEVEENCN